MGDDQYPLVPMPVELQDLIMGLCVDSWRFSRVYLRVLSKLDAVDQPKYQGKYYYYLKQLEDRIGLLRIKLVNLEGQRFDPGFPVNILNLGDFASDELLLIDQMLEPVIMGPEGVLRMGTCLVKRG